MYPGWEDLPYDLRIVLCARATLRLRLRRLSETVVAQSDKVLTFESIYCTKHYACILDACSVKIPMAVLTKRKLVVNYCSPFTTW